MMLQLLKNKRVICSFLVCFLLIFISSVYISETTVNQEMQSEDNSKDLTVSECICAALSETGVFSARTNHKHVNAGRYYNNKITPIQASKVASTDIKEYSLITLPFYNIICALLGLKVIIFIFSSDGKKRIKIY